MAVIGGRTLTAHLGVNNTTARRNVTTDPIPTPSILRRLAVFSDATASGAGNGEFDVLVTSDDDSTNNAEPAGTSLVTLARNPTNGPNPFSAAELPYFVLAGSSVELEPGVAFDAPGQRLKLTAARSAAGTVALVLIAEFDLVDVLPAGAGGAGIVPREQPGEAPPAPPPAIAPALPPPPAIAPALAAAPPRAELAMVDYVADPLPEPCDVDPHAPLQSSLDRCVVA